MLNTVKAIVRNGKIELLEPIDLPEGTAMLVTVLNGDEEFWLKASDTSLAAVWNNDADDTYEQLLDR